MYRELRALVPRTRSDQSRRVYFSEHFKREYRLVRGELSRFLIINQSCEKLRLLFLPTLLSYSSRFLCALQQNRAHSRPLFLLTNVESYNNSIGIVSVSVWENPSPSILLSCLIKEETWFWPNKDFISANLKYKNVLPTRFEILKIRFTIKCAKKFRLEMPPFWKQLSYPAANVKPKRAVRKDLLRHAGIEEIKIITYNLSQECLSAWLPTVYTDIKRGLRLALGQR